jgi:hypothetical protein
MTQGLKLLEQGKREDLPEAATRFREAIEIRRAAPPTGDIWQRYNLSGSYMSLGDVLTRQGTPESLAEGGQAYDTAMTILRTLPLDGDPLFARRLLIGYLNSGLNRLFQGPDSLAGSAADFAAALGLADSVHVKNWPDRALLAAAAAANLGSAELRRGAWDAAIAAAGRAAAEAAAEASQQVGSADAAIRARHTLLSALVSRWQKSGAPRPDAATLSASTDAAEEGLELAKEWEAKGVTWFRPLATDLFRTGAQLYAHFQPQFLGEFLTEYGAADPAMANDLIQAAIKKRLPS